MPPEEIQQSTGIESAVMDSREERNGAQIDIATERDVSFKNRVLKLNVTREAPAAGVKKVIIIGSGDVEVVTGGTGVIKVTADVSSKTPEGTKAAAYALYQKSMPVGINVGSDKVARVVIGGQIEVGVSTADLGGIPNWAREQIRKTTITKSRGGYNSSIHMSGNVLRGGSTQSIVITGNDSQDEVVISQDGHTLQMNGDGTFFDGKRVDKDASPVTKPVVSVSKTRIVLPENVEVEIQSPDGNVSLQNVHGNIVVNALTGDVTLRNCRNGATINGARSVDADSVSGPLNVNDPIEDKFRLRNVSDVSFLTAHDVDISGARRVSFQRNTGNLNISDTESLTFERLTGDGRFSNVQNLHIGGVVGDMRVDRSSVEIGRVTGDLTVNSVQGNIGSLIGDIRGRATSPNLTIDRMVGDSH